MRKWTALLFFVLTTILCLSSQGTAQTQKSKYCDSGSDPKVAVVNGTRVITQSEIDESIKYQMHELQEKIYNLRKAALDRLLIMVILEDEAKSQGISVEQLQSRINSDKVRIEKSQIDKAYADNANALSGMDEYEARQRVKLDLETQYKLKNYKAAIDELRNKANIEIFLRPPDPPKIAFRTDGPSKGSKQPTITIVEFSDFQCPYCKQARVVLDQIVRTYDSEVRLVFKHMPLRIHPDAFMAAQAAHCADEQGKFWEYHDNLFNSSQINTEALGQYAVRLGLNKDKFDACLVSESSRDVVLRDMLEAKRVGIQGTPSFIINGKIVKGVRDYDDFKKIIEQELSTTKKDNNSKSEKIIK